MANNNRATFGSKLGILLATVGCAVGLGNIWRFPYTLGENGGAAFLLIYILCILLIGTPVMLAEFFIGRYSRSNTVGAFKRIAPGSKWSFIGYNGIFISFLILGFYLVIAGWTLEYLTQSFDSQFFTKSPEAFKSDFNSFVSGITRPMIWTTAFLLLTHMVIISGVSKGIERASKVMMPVLFFILIILCIRSVMLPGAIEGITFLFKPDFSKIDSTVALNAMGQAFFSLSLGMGSLITYSSYFSKKTNMVSIAVQVTLLDTLVAILAAVMVFPAVFSFGIEPSAGFELLFITLPNVFAQMSFGQLWSVIFFVLLVIAALTSTISLHEVVTAYIHEEFHLGRKWAAVVVSLGVLALATLCTLSFSILSEVKILDMTFFALFDFLSAKFMMPLGSMFICIFLALRIDNKILKSELTNNGSVAFYGFSVFVFALKYIAPIVIGVIFLNGLGVF